MSAAESQVRAVATAKAIEAGQKVLISFAASKGPWYGFNGIYEYVVTNEAVWEGRGGVGSLAGGSTKVHSWPRGEVSLTWRGAGSKSAELVTPQGVDALAFSDPAVAEQASRALSL